MYYLGFQDIDACEIWIYDKKTLESLTKNDIFLKVTEENIAKVQHYFDNLYMRVTVKEREKFNKLVSKENFIKTGDYFCFRENTASHRIILLYLDLKENHVLTLVSLG